MAQNVIINGVTYPAVPKVNIPKADGGTAEFYDTASADIQPSDVVAGKTAYGPNGVVNGTGVYPSVSQDSSTKVLSIS